jgi:hypothetical protein
MHFLHDYAERVMFTKDHESYKNSHSFNHHGHQERRITANKCINELKIMNIRTGSSLSKEV